MAQVRRRTWDLFPVQGESFRRVLSLRESDGSTVDLSLWTWRGPIRSDKVLDTQDAASWSFALASDKDGQADRAVEFSLTSQELAGLSPARYVSQIWGTDPDGEPACILELNLHITRGLL